MKPRVLVVGAGGLGGVIAARLRRDGVDVGSLVRPGPIAEALAARGLVLRDGDERVEVPARPLTSLDGEGPVDVAVLATQPTDVEGAARLVLPHLAPDGTLVVLQNGLCEPRVAALAGQERVVGAVVAWGASVVAPGVVECTSRGRFTLGRWDGAPDAAVARVAELLAPVAPCDVTDNLAGARWSKLTLNCAISTLGTIGGDRVGPLIRHRFVRRLALEVMTEVVAVARAEGVRLEKLAGTIDLEWLALKEAERRPGPSVTRTLKHAAVLGVGTKIRNLRSSMLRAIEKGEPPAVDFLNGEIVARGRLHGVPTPTNEAAAAMVHAIARGEHPPSLDTLRALHARTR